MNADQKELMDVSGIIGDDGTVDGDIWTVRSGSLTSTIMQTVTGLPR